MSAPDGTDPPEEGSDVSIEKVTSHRAKRRATFADGVAEVLRADSPTWRRSLLVRCMCMIADVHGTPSASRFEFLLMDSIRRDAHRAARVASSLRRGFGEVQVPRPTLRLWHAVPCASVGRTTRQERGPTIGRTLAESTGGSADLSFGGRSNSRSVVRFVVRQRCKQKRRGLQAAVDRKTNETVGRPTGHELGAPRRSETIRPPLMEAHPTRRSCAPAARASNAHVPHMRERHSRDAQNARAPPARARLYLTHMQRAHSLPTYPRPPSTQPTEDEHGATRRCGGTRSRPALSAWAILRHLVHNVRAPTGVK